MRDRIRSAGPDRRVLAALIGLGALVFAGCGGALAPEEVPGEPAPEMERQVEGLELPDGAARVAVIADDGERSIAEYVVSDTSVDDVEQLHIDRLTDNGWQENEDRRADIDPQGVRLRFGRGTWETPEGVESQRFRLTVEIVPDGDNVRLTWTVVDQQAVRG
jgi:hypothetical protein